MTLLTPLGLLAGLLAIPVLAAHILTPRRDRHPVSSTYLWQSMVEPVAPSRPWQRIRWSVPLLLQLLLVALVALAFAQPALVRDATLDDHTVFIIDASASMRASDETPDRLEAAKDAIDDLLEDLPVGAIASLVVAGTPAEVAVATTDDLGEFRTALDRVRLSSGPADFAQAFLLAESLVTPDRPTGHVLVSDGGVGQEAQAVAPPGMRYESIGGRDVNRAITALTVQRDDAGLTALVAITNTGGPSATQPLRVDVDNVTVARRDITVGAGEAIEVDVPIPPGARVEAFLDGDDLLALDNQRAALAPFVTELRVRVDSATDRGSFFIVEALRALGATQVFDRTEPVDLVVYDGIDPPATPTTPFISVASPTPPDGVRVLGALDRPIPTLLSDAVLLRGIDITGTAVASAQALAVEPGAEVLIGAAGGEPLLVRGRSGAVGWFHLAFDLEQSNLPIEVAYPVLVSRMVAALTLSDEVPASVEVGRRLPSLTEPVVVTSPHGVTRQVDAGGVMPLLDETGFWTVTEPDGSVRPVAVVFPAAESTLTVADDLPGVPAAPEVEEVATSAPSHRSLVDLLLLAAVIVVLIEFALALRRAPTPRRQRLGSAVLRIAVVGCLFGALVGFDLTRSNDDVRAVVVLDRSDSMGDDGAAQVDQIRAALADRIAAGDIAIVEVGRTARVTVPFDGDTRSDASPDGDGSDLVFGLRLADSLLDGSTSERVVLVSDGRATGASVADEASRLADAEVRIDVMPIEPRFDFDVGIDVIDAPSSVAEGEAYRAEVVVIANEPGAVTVELLRDGELVETTEADLAAGENRVGFDLAAESGLDRLEARLVGHIDAISENDAAHAALHVEGPPRVLIVEGLEGNGEHLQDAFDARTLLNERIDVSDFPTFEALAAYRAVVLVDVHADDLADEHVAALSGFVRDQGNGLVVVGGTNSFALGDYGETELEDLLPIESRASDALRDASLAEVLLIDASESMGTCHCRPVEGSSDPFAGEFIENGVDKTDISKAAAARAADALDAQDDLGILAFNGNQTWVLPLQALPDQSTIQDSLGQLSPSGETRIGDALAEAAAALRENDKELRHIILFTDGFTPELMNEGMTEADMEMMGIPSFRDIEEHAAELADEGITVSVVATGEGAAPLLEAIAIAGGGRFYPGRDLEEIPEIFVEEARIASRSFINEGSYLPTVTSTAEPVRNLDAAPQISGYVAGTAKDTTDVMMQVGEFADPLLASWRVGLGQVTTWASDSGDRWATDWVGWDGWADFWSTIVRDVLPLEGASGHELRATMTSGSLSLELVGEESWPAGTAPVASIAAPDGTRTTVELARASDTTFTAVVPATDVGSYAVGVHTEQSGSSSQLATAVATRSYSLEYQPRPPAVDVLIDLSTVTGGRGAITVDDVLNADGLVPGETTRPLRWILLLIAALLWPLAVILRHVNLAQLPDDVRATRAARRRRSSQPPPIPPPPAGVHG